MHNGQESPFVVYRDHGFPYGENEALGRRMPAPAEQAVFGTRMDSYQGMWHGQSLIPNSEYIWKYSGGLATYPYQHRPMAVYAEAAHKTFFCWGGATPENYLARERYWDFGPGNLLQMVSAYDHHTNTLERPVCVYDKWCADPHDNPVLQIDSQGFIWLFSPSHGGWTTRSFIHRSCAPYDITQWETVSDGPLYSYPQPWVHPALGWCLIHVHYGADGSRGLYVKYSRDGGRWSEPFPLALIAKGHYAVSWADPVNERIGVAFDYHPEEGGLDARTNLYYLESHNWGRTWQTIDGVAVEGPIRKVNNVAKVLDLEATKELNYLRDLKFTATGEPVVLFVSSRHWHPGPTGDPRHWETCSWTGQRWERRQGMKGNNNYDHGELGIDDDGGWRIIAPTDPGPQCGNPGGEVALWRSFNQGQSWFKERDLTQGSSRNHTFCRIPLNAHSDFYSFWADGDARRPSISHLYFCNREGTRVTRME